MPRCLLLILVLLLGCAYAEELTLTYVTEHELDQADNYVQVTLSLSLQGRSLQASIGEAEEMIEEIKRISNDYCRTHAASKQEKQACAQATEVSEFEVEPKYHNIRKIKTFSSFILSYEITLAVHHTKAIGSLIDSVLKVGGENIVLNEIVWKAHQEQDAEVIAIREGMEQGEEMCAKFGKHLAEVLQVEQLEEEEEENEEEEEERDEDLAEEEVEVTTMRFRVKCDDKK